MEEILRIIVEYASIWAPSLVAIIGIVSTILTALTKMKDALETLKADKTLKDIEKKLSQVAVENDELIRCNKLLLEEITRIKDYADLKKKEK